MGFPPDALKAENLPASVHAPFPAIVRLRAVSMQHFFGCFKRGQNNSCIAQKKHLYLSHRMLMRSWCGVLPQQRLAIRQQHATVVSSTLLLWWI